MLRIVSSERSDSGDATPWRSAACRIWLFDVTPFEQVASSHEVEYVEVALWMRKEALIERHRHRLRHETDPVAAGIADVIARGGGERLVAKIHDDYTAFQQSRPHAITIDVEGQTADETYLALKAALLPGAGMAAGGRHRG